MSIVYCGYQPLQLTSMSVPASGRQLSLLRINREDGGTPLLLFPGFLEDSRLFLQISADKKVTGIAAWLAEQGFDVFIAGGFGCNQGSQIPESSLNDVICKSIPAYARRIEQLCPNLAQVWVGQGLACSGLVSAYLRAKGEFSVAGFCHFGAQRFMSWGSNIKATGLALWQLFSRSEAALNGGVSAKLYARKDYRETASLLKELIHWYSYPEWKDLSDGFDYTEAVNTTQLPPSLYFCSSASYLWGLVDDLRFWIRELGEHDGRTIVLNRRHGNKHSYRGRKMLVSEAGALDHWPQLSAWLREILVVSRSQRENISEPRG